MLNKLETALVEAIQDEYKARATYSLVIEKFGPIQALVQLFCKYNLTIPIDNWAERVTAPDSVLEACQQGVIAERENEIMYNRLLTLTTEYPDVQRVFLNLKRASL